MRIGLGLVALAAGLIIGLSPGFRVPPQRAVPDAEEVTEEPVKPEEDMHGALIRTVKSALLYELSLVTRPAYEQTQVELRNWTVPESRAFGPFGAPTFVRRRWRL